MNLMSTGRENGEIVITSGDRLTIETAADFRRLLAEGLEAAQQVSIEFQPEVAIDITALHAICSACKTAASLGKSFSYQGPRPRSLDDLVEACGAGRHTVCNQNNDLGCIWFGGAK